MWKTYEWFCLNLKFYSWKQEPCDSYWINEAYNEQQGQSYHAEQMKVPSQIIIRSDRSTQFYRSGSNIVFIYKHRLI